MGFSHKGGAALLPTNHEVNLTLTRMQTVEHSKVTFAWNAKGMGHALSNQAINEKVAGKLFSHADIVPRLMSKTGPLWNLPDS